jgi:hypothetical protein
MEIIIYFYENREPGAPENRFSVQIPQLITDANGATREEARKNAVREVFTSLAFYVECGRIAPEEAEAVRIVESEDQPSAKELARLTPQWFQDAVQNDPSETHPAP